MLHKRDVEGPTRIEWAMSALTPETARLLKESITVREDGSMTFSMSAPPEVLAQVAVFLERLGETISYVPPRVGLDECLYELDELFRWVAREDIPVEVEVGGELVHVARGPADRPRIDGRQLALQAERAARHQREGRPALRPTQ